MQTGASKTHEGLASPYLKEEINPRPQIFDASYNHKKNVYTHREVVSLVCCDGRDRQEEGGEGWLCLGKCSRTCSLHGSLGCSFVNVSSAPVDAVT